MSVMYIILYLYIIYSLANNNTYGGEQCEYGCKTEALIRSDLLVTLISVYIYDIRKTINQRREVNERAHLVARPAADTLKGRPSQGERRKIFNSVGIKYHNIV